MSDELTPITRKETFLAKAGGQNVVTPTPITREETFLQAIIDNGSGGGGGGGGGLIVTLTMNDDTITSDKTWNEIKNGVDNKLFVQCQMPSELMTNIFYLTSLGEVPLGDEYFMNIYDLENAEPLSLTCSNADDYPSVTMGG